MAEPSKLERCIVVACESAVNWPKGQHCDYPKCGCDKFPRWVPRIITAALADDPETIEAMESVEPGPGGRPVREILDALRRHILGESSCPVKSDNS